MERQEYTGGAGAAEGVLKTVPRVAEGTGVLGSNVVRHILLAATCSFIACAAAMYKWMRHHHGTQNVLQESLSEQVPAVLFAMPIAAFGGVLLLNLLNAAHSQNDTRFKYNLALLFVNAVALSTDILIFLRLTPVALAGNGRLIHPLRYIQWSHSTPTMIYMLSLLSDLSSNQVLFVMSNDLCMILTGLASTMSSSTAARLAWGAVSFANFAVVLAYLSIMVSSAAGASSDKRSQLALRIMLLVTVVIWSSYPAAWLLSELGCISPAVEQLLWGLLDYMAKAVFTSQLWQTNVKTTQERRNQALQMWETSNRTMVVDKLHQLVLAKEQMLRMMSNELRTPLQGVMAMVSTLIREAGAPRHRERVRQLTMVRSCLSCLNNIVTTTLGAAAASGTGSWGSAPGQAAADGVLPHTAVGAGPAPALRLHALVDGVVAVIRPLVHDGVQLLNEVPETLPVIAADRTKLSQIFYNLIGNAARFTHMGHIKILAKVTSSTCVEVTVVDTGVGVAADKLESIFSGSNQADIDIAAAHGGLGLGLYLVKLALASCGSSVTVRSELGQGTSFTFPLTVADAGAEVESLSAGSDSGQSSEVDAQEPAPDAAVAASSAASAAAPSSAATADNITPATPRRAGERLRMPNRFSGGGRKLQILSVDDDVINQLVAEQMLKHEKWQVVKAFDGLQALDYIENQAQALPDLILLDIMMPNMNGYELCAKLREHYPSALLPIIMVSAKGGQEDIVEALRLGADDYVPKPYKRAEMAERIRAQLRSRDSARQFDVLAALTGGASGPLGDDSGDTVSVEVHQSPMMMEERYAAVLCMKLVGVEEKLASATSAANRPCAAASGEPDGSSEFAATGSGLRRTESWLSPRPSQKVLAAGGLIGECGPPGLPGLKCRNHQTSISDTEPTAATQAARAAAGLPAAAAAAAAAGPAAGAPQDPMAALQAAKQALQAAIAQAYSRLDHGSGPSGSPRDAQVAYFSTSEQPSPVSAPDAIQGLPAFTSTPSSPPPLLQTGSGAGAPAALAPSCLFADLAHDTFAAVLPLFQHIGRHQAESLSQLASAAMEQAACLRWPDGSCLQVQAGLHCCKVRLVRQQPGGYDCHSAALEAAPTTKHQHNNDSDTSAENQQQQQQQVLPCTLLTPTPAALLSLAGCSPAGCLVLSDAARAELAAGCISRAPSMSRVASARALDAADQQQQKQKQQKQQQVPLVRCQLWRVRLPAAGAGPNGPTGSGPAATPMPAQQQQQQQQQLSSGPVIPMYIAELGAYEAALAAGPGPAQGAAAAAVTALGLLLLPPAALPLGSGSGEEGGRVPEQLLRCPEREGPPGLELVGNGRRADVGSSRGGDHGAFLESENRRLQLQLLKAQAVAAADREAQARLLQELRLMLEAERQRVDVLVQDAMSRAVQAEIGQLRADAQDIRSKVAAVHRQQQQQQQQQQLQLAMAPAACSADTTGQSSSNVLARGSDRPATDQDRESVQASPGVGAAASGPLDPCSVDGASAARVSALYGRHWAGGLR